jgi:hypothetical protein
MSQSFHVYFPAERGDLDAAAEKLRSSRFQVSSADGRLQVEREGLSFQIYLSTEPHVAVEAGEIAEGTPHEEAMRSCDARFEVSVGDFERAIDEINTMMSLQGALQDLCQGYLFLSWNGTIMEPWTG